MNKKELKQLINEEFGFAISKIEIIDCDYDRDTSYPIWISFYVCNFEYAMVYEYREKYVLKVIHTHGRIELGLSRQCNRCAYARR